jgi:hypothetical protein
MSRPEASVRIGGGGWGGTVKFEKRALGRSRLAGKPFLQSGSWQTLRTRSPVLEVAGSAVPPPGAD